MFFLNVTWYQQGVLHGYLNLEIAFFVASRVSRFVSTINNDISLNILAFILNRILKLFSIKHYEILKVRNLLESIQFNGELTNL